MNDALHMLIGAGLVVVGVLASALADRIRGLKIQRAQARELAPASSPRASTPPRGAKLPEVRAEIPVVPTVIRKAAAARETVLAAMIGAGWGKREAAQAVDACELAERATIE